MDDVDYTISPLYPKAEEEFMGSPLDSSGVAGLSKASRGRAFMVEEDEQLCRSWLANYFDPPIAASNQKGTTFWARIRSHYDRNKTWEDERSENSLMHRWSTIQTTVNKFSGYVAQVENQNVGESSEADIIAEAKRLYSKSCRRAFTLTHCWVILHHNDKWQMYLQKHPTKFPDPSKPMTNSSSPLNLDSGNSEAEDHMNDNGKPEENTKAKKGAKLQQKKRDYEEVITKLTEQNQKLVDIMIRKENRAYKREARRDEREQIMEDDWIMKVDTSGMNEMQKAYYAHRQAEILARSMPACTNEG